MTQFIGEVDVLVQQPPHRELHDSHVNTSTPNPPSFEDDSVSVRGESKVLQYF